MTLIDRDKIPFGAHWKEANFFAEDIVCAVGTDYMQKIAEAEHRFICDLLNGLQQVDVVDAVPVVRCRDCKHRRDRLYCRLRKTPAIVTNTDFCSYGERKDEE